MKSENKLISIRSRILAVCVASAVLPVSATAAVYEEEIIVTAQKREQNLQDIPISVTAYTGNQLRELGLTEMTEITQQMPGLQLSAWSPNLTIFNLRGISQNSFTDNLEAPVAVYVDDAYVGTINGLSGQMFDMKRVEVLRGPQGTLFGRNATGGLIHYISEDASSAETNGYIEAEAGEFNRTAIEFAFGGSLSDTVRARISGRWMEQDGYIESVDTIVPGGGPTIFNGSGQDIGGADGYALRATMQVDFSDRLTGNFWIKYSEDDEVATGGYVFENCPFQAPPNDTLCQVDANGRAITQGGVIDLFGLPADEHEHYAEHPGILNREQTSLTGRLDYEMENGVAFTSITNYMVMDKFYDEDGDALGVPILTFQTFVDWTQFSQEFRFSGETDTISWQTGLFYLNMENDGGTSVSGAPAFGQLLASGKVVAAGGVDTALATAFPGNGFEGAIGPQNYVLDSRNFSVFGQADFKLTDALTVTAGLRWSQDDKEISQTIFFTDNFNPTPILVDSSAAKEAINSGVDEIDYGDWAGRLALNLALSENTIVFASVNRGIKGGNWSTGVGSNVTAANFQHDEEILWSYEAGVKTGGDTYRINATVYYYDYEDYQAFSLAGGGPFISNSDAESTGGEVEFYWFPTDNFEASFGAAFIDSEVDTVQGANSILGTGTAADIRNAEFPNAPALSFNYLLRYNLDVGAGNLAFQVDGVWNDDQFLEVTNGSGTVQESYNVSNARISFDSASDRYSVTGWVKNFTDEIYKVYSLDLGVLGATTYYAPPITYGVTARFNF